MGRPAAGRVMRRVPAARDGLELLGDVESGGFSGHVGVGGDYDLAHLLDAHPVEQLGQMQLLRTDAVEGRERSAQHVVEAAILVGALDADDVPGLLHHADGGDVSPRVAADVAQLLLGEVEAARAEADGLFDLDEAWARGRASSGGSLSR